MDKQKYGGGAGSIKVQPDLSAIEEEWNALNTLKNIGRNDDGLDARTDDRNNGGKGDEEWDTK